MLTTSKPKVGLFTSSVLFLPVARLVSSNFFSVISVDFCEQSGHEDCVGETLSLTCEASRIKHFAKECSTGWFGAKCVAHRHPTLIIKLDCFWSQAANWCGLGFKLPCDR